MTKPKATKTEKTPLLTTHKPTTPAAAVTRAVALVTPALAAEWLKSNTNNRVVSVRGVKALAAEITGGRWRVTHQGIAFDADGVLLDGQHRLHAIIDAGIAVSIEVTRGLTKSDADAIDTGGCGRRRTNDVLRISDGIGLTTNQAGALSAAYEIIEHGTLARGMRHTPDMLRRAHATHREALDAITTALGHGHSGRLVSSTVIGALLIAFGVHPGETVDFAGMLRTGADLGPAHPALALRNFLLNRASAFDREARDDVSLRVFAAVLAYAEGRQLQRLLQSTSARDYFVAAWRKANG